MNKREATVKALQYASGLLEMEADLGHFEVMAGDDGIEDLSDQDKINKAVKEIADTLHRRAERLTKP